MKSKRRRSTHYYREYRSACGRSMSVGDVVSVRHRSGLYLFKAFVLPRVGPEAIWTVGMDKGKKYGKHCPAYPEHVELVTPGNWPQTSRMKRMNMVEPGLPYEDEPYPEPLYVEVGNRPAPPPRNQERLTCKACGEDWFREIKRGPKPKTCPDCK